MFIKPIAKQKPRKIPPTSLSHAPSPKPQNSKPDSKETDSFIKSIDGFFSSRGGQTLGGALTGAIPIFGGLNNITKGSSVEYSKLGKEAPQVASFAEGASFAGGFANILGAMLVGMSFAETGPHIGIGLGLIGLSSATNAFVSYINSSGR